MEPVFLIPAFSIGTAIVCICAVILAHRKGIEVFSDVWDGCFLASLVGLCVGLLLGSLIFSIMNPGGVVRDTVVRNDSGLADSIADDPKAWICGRVKDVERLSVDGVVLVIDRKIADFEDMAKRTDDAGRLVSYGSAIGALKRERTNILESGFDSCRRGR